MTNSIKTFRAGMILGKAVVSLCLAELVGQPDLADSVLTIKSGFGGSAIHLMQHHKTSSSSC